MDLQEIPKRYSKQHNLYRFCQFHYRAKLNLVLCRFEEVIKECRQAVETLKDDCNFGGISSRLSELTVVAVETGGEGFECSQVTEHFADTAACIALSLRLYVHSFLIYSYAQMFVVYDCEI